MLRFGVVVSPIPLIELGAARPSLGTSLPAIDDFADWADRIA